MAQLLPQGRDAGGLYNAYVEASTSNTAQPSAISLPDSFAEMTLESSKSRASRLPPRQIYRPPHARYGQSSRRSYAPPTSPSFAPGSQMSRVRHGAMPAAMPTALISLLHTLLHSYPSQSAYQSQLKSSQHLDLGARGNGAYHPGQWLRSISTALATGNYARFGRLTRSPEVEIMCRSLGSYGSGWPHARDAEARLYAVKCLIEDLRAKVRESAWVVMATAYYELDVTQSAGWLLQGLMIEGTIARDDVDIPRSALAAVERWLGERGETEVKRKEGVEGRWIMRRGRR